jgi:hypothetical protein
MSSTRTSVIHSHRLRFDNSYDRRGVQRNVRTAKNVATIPQIARLSN